MRGLFFAIAVALWVPSMATAATTRCTIDGDVLGPRLVSWDTGSGVAEITLGDHSVHKGRVTRVQDREPRAAAGRGQGELAQAVNLRFDSIGSNDETEYMVIPTATGSAIFGAGYDDVEGARYLAAHHHILQAHCD